MRKALSLATPWAMRSHLRGKCWPDGEAAAEDDCSEVDDRQEEWAEDGEQEEAKIFAFIADIFFLKIESLN
jgi:hypothetical protein